MIIDFHAHWWPGREYVNSRQSWKLIVAAINKTYYKALGIDLTDKALEKIYFDQDGSMLLEQMEIAGVDMTVLLPLDWGLVYGETDRDILEQNRVFAKFSQEHPDSIIAFFSIDPRREGAVRHFQTAVEDGAMKGLKLYPPTGFYPDDEVCQPLYEICLDRGLPVVYHAAPSPMQQVEYSHPDCFRRLAEKFPRLKIVMAHAGGEWAGPAVAACRDHENIYMDISGWQTMAGGEPDGVSYLFSKLDSFEKVFWGTDNPIFNGLMKAPDWVSSIKQSDIPEKEKSNLLGDSAARLLRLPG